MNIIQPLNYMMMLNTFWYKIWIITFFLMMGTAFQLAKEPVFIPPQMVPIVDNFFVDDQEVTVLAYRRYLTGLKLSHGAESDRYLSAMVDTTVWEGTGSDSDRPLMETYFHHPTFHEYPVIGVSHSQAEAFCKYRGEKLQERIQKDPQLKQHIQSIEMRLPTSKEWLFISKLNESKFARMQLKKKDKGKHPYNFTRINQDRGYSFSDTYASAIRVGPAKSYWPGKLEIYNLYGNVAEMVAEVGIAYGGAWIHTEADGLSDEPVAYEGADYWLGFRCVCQFQ